MNQDPRQHPLNHDHSAPNRAPDTQTCGNEDFYVLGALRRLRESEAFSEQQLRLVEAELRRAIRKTESSDFIMLPKAGDRIGELLVEDCLGQGGDANVFRVRNVENGELAAFKMLHRVENFDRFCREMRSVQQLAHPNIVTAYEVGDRYGTPYIVMELMPGPDLHAHVTEHGPIQWQIAAKYVHQIACALEHAHSRGLIHRDVKPGNILLGHDLVKLSDLGLAAVNSHQCTNGTANASHLTRNAQIAGTLPFMAPEQARSLAAATAQSDIYSLGASWYFLLTGQYRLRGESFSAQFTNLLAKRAFRQLPDCMPESLQAIYSRMVAYEPHDRYDDCAELVSDIERALRDVDEVIATQKFSVLIVEDSLSDMVLTTAMLRKANKSLSIFEATSLAEGLDLFSTIDVHMILLDLTLPDSSGVTTVQRVFEVAPETPIVVLTGMAEEQLAEQCMLAGATDFVCKNDLTPSVLERAIFVTMSRYGGARDSLLSRNLE